jgi:indole-3-pyruvate monooxygenase
MPLPPREDPADVTRTTVIVVGAGPAGLSVAACLTRSRIPFLVLEQSDKVGASWHRHYERLHLHTDKAHSALPFFPIPREYPRYLSRLQVIEYLEAYSRQHLSALKLGQRVISARSVNGRWRVQTQDALFESPYLVIAAGYNREPYTPSWPGQPGFQGAFLHSSQYRSGEAFRDKQVLVIGFGNSGGEIAIDLHEHGAHPSLSVRGPVNVLPRELLGVPILTIAIAESMLPPRWADALNAPILRAAIGNLAPYGLRKDSRGAVSRIRGTGRVPLIDVGTIGLIKKGSIGVFPGIERFTEDGVTFTNGEHRRFDAAIAATGYRPSVDALLPDAASAYGEDGVPFCSGREAGTPGLYYCGYNVSPTGMLRDIAREARQIGDAIAAALERTDHPIR